mgnify:CR=1 FL=1
MWGQGFPEPRFSGRFAVEGQRVVGEKHCRLTLGLAGRRFAAIRFGEPGPFPAAIDAVYRLDVNEFGGGQPQQRIQYIIAGPDFDVMTAATPKIMEAMSAPAEAPAR